MTSGQDSSAGLQIKEIICHKQRTDGRLNSTQIASSINLEVNYLGRLSSCLVVVWVSECDGFNVSHEEVEQSWANDRDDIFHVQSLRKCHSTKTYIWD